MSRRRLNVPGGTYYVVQLSSAQQVLFSDPAHYALFERLLAQAVKRTHTKVLGYCWLPRSVHLVLQAGAVPIGRFMQGFTASYARTLHRQTRESGHLFAQRYRAVLVDFDTWLLSLIRYIHFLPVLHGLAAGPDGWPHTSHHAYAGRHRAAWLSTKEVCRLLRAGEQDAGPAEAESYHVLMSRPPSSDEIRLVELGSVGDARVLGEPRIRPDTADPNKASRLTVDGIVRAVLQLLEIDRAELFSRSRRREVVLARAAIAWQLTERRLLTLSAIATHLGRDISTISVAIRRYRVQRPDVFRLDAISPFTPLARK